MTICGFAGSSLDSSLDGSLRCSSADRSPFASARYIGVASVLPHESSLSTRRGR